MPPPSPNTPDPLKLRCPHCQHNGLRRDGHSDGRPRGKCPACSKSSYLDKSTKKLARQLPNTLNDPTEAARVVEEPPDIQLSPKERTGHINSQQYQFPSYEAPPATLAERIHQSRSILAKKIFGTQQKENAMTNPNTDETTNDEHEPNTTLLDNLASLKITITRMEEENLETRAYLAKLERHVLQLLSIVSQSYPVNTQSQPKNQPQNPHTSRPEIWTNLEQYSQQDSESLSVEPTALAGNFRAQRLTTPVWRTVAPKNGTQTINQENKNKTANVGLGLGA